MADSFVDPVARGIGIGAAGFGLVAMAAPRALRTMYGDSTPAGGMIDYLGRTWGTRTAAFGALSLTAPESDRKRVATVAAAMNAVDALVALRASGLPARTRAMAALTSATFAALAGYVATNS